MGLLSGELTEQDVAFDTTSTTDVKKYKRGAVSDIALGAVSGVGKGVLSVSNGLSRFVEGDEVADKRMQQVNEAFTPKNQGTAGHVASGITEVVSAGVVGSPLGALGVAGAVGIGTRASEHTRLTQQLGVDQDTADTASNIHGLTNAVLAGLPISNVFRSGLADYGALVVAPTIAGQGMTYLEGSVLESNGYEKQGQMYKDMATDPTMVAMNLGIGSAFFTLGRLRSDPNASQQQIKEAEAQAYDAVDQAIAEADKTSMPTQHESVGDLLQHEANINQAIDQVMKGEKVNILEATGGQLKSLDDVRNYIQNNRVNNTAKERKLTLTEATEQNRKIIWEQLNPGQKYPSTKPSIAKPFTASGTQKRIYEEARSNGLSDSDARTIVALAHFESGGTFDPKVKNKKSSARGVFQFIDDTWKSEGGTSANRFDLDTQIKLGIQHTKSNIKYIEKKTGVVLTGSQIYIPHLLGRGGAEIVFRAIKENPSQSARSVISKFSKNPDHLMQINGIPKGAKIQDVVQYFTKKIDGIAAKHYGAEKSLDDVQIAETIADSSILNDVALPTRDLSNLDTTVHRTDLDTIPDIDSTFISPHDIDAFEAKNKVSDDPLADLTEMLPVLDNFEALSVQEKVKQQAENDPVFMKEIDKLVESFVSETEHTAIPHTSKGVQVKDRVNDPAKEFKPDDSIVVEWKQTQRYEDKKYHDQLTRSYKDKDGNTVQEMKYRDSYAHRILDSKGITHSIHVGRSNKSDFVNHKGNKELETALNRIFDTHNYGYLSQIPKGYEAIAKLESDPNLVISSKKTGEDLTAQQWKQKLQKEQDNITMMTKAMQTLAKCALKKAA